MDSILNTVAYWMSDMQHRVNPVIHLAQDSVSKYNGQGTKTTTCVLCLIYSPSIHCCYTDENICLFRYLWTCRP